MAQRSNGILRHGSSAASGQVATRPLPNNVWATRTWRRPFGWASISECSASRAWVLTARRSSRRICPVWRFRMAASVSKAQEMRDEETYRARNALEPRASAASGCKALAIPCIRPSLGFRKRARQRLPSGGSGAAAQPTAASPASAATGGATRRRARQRLPRAGCRRHALRLGRRTAAQDIETGPGRASSS